MTTTTDTNATILAEHPFALAEFFAGFSLMQIRTGHCCCCAEPRPMVRFGPDGAQEWGHVDDETFAEHRHVHVDSTARDCDGRYDHGHVLRIPSIRPEALRPAYLGGDASFYDLWMYVMRHEPNLTSEGATIEVEGQRIRWSYRTDEGGGAGEAWVCEDTYCAHDERTFRDHTAEAAGY